MTGSADYLIWYAVAPPPQDPRRERATGDTTSVRLLMRQSVSTGGAGLGENVGLQAFQLRQPHTPDNLTYMLTLRHLPRNGKLLPKLVGDIAVKAFAAVATSALEEEAGA